jgi:hypothetical protein
VAGALALTGAVLLGVDRARRRKAVPVTVDRDDDRRPH